VAIKGGENLMLLSSNDPNPRKPDPDYLSSRSSADISAYTTLKLPPGNYTLVFTVDVAVLSANTAPVMAGGAPGQARGWPKARAAWVETVNVPITVVPADQSPVGLTTDAALDPQTTGAIQLKAIKVIRRGTGQRVNVEISIDGKSVPCSFDVVLKIAGKEHPLGYVLAWPNRSQTTELAVDLTALDPGVVSADLLLRPNAKHAEGIPGIDRVWGGPVDLLNVPVTRYDLQGK
jgi:hypothetical protein